MHLHYLFKKDYNNHNNFVNPIELLYFLSSKILQTIKMLFPL